jgi:hypothetical protein
MLVAAGGTSHHTTAALRQRIAAVARRTARSLDDSSPLKAVRVYGPASYRAVLNASDRTTTTNRRKGRFYVIVLHGRFVCTWWSTPAGRSIAPWIDCHEDLVAERARRRFRYPQQAPRIVISARQSHPG